MPDQIIHRKLSPSFKWRQQWSQHLCLALHTQTHIQWLPCLPQGHGRFHLIGKRRLTLFSDDQIRVRLPKNTKAGCYISSKPHDSSQGAWRPYLKSPSRRILQNTLFIQFTEIEVWRLTQRNKNVKTLHKGSPSPGMAQRSPELQPTTLGPSTRSPVLTAAIPNFPKTYDYIWNHCCLWLSSPREPNIENPPKRIPTEVTNSAKMP